MFPFEITAVPIETILDSDPEEVLIATLTVWTPTLYPDPLFPILIEVMVPAADTTAVPPAEIKGWYPRPESEPTETIIPPLGKLEIPTSGPSGTVLVPWKAIEEIPEDSWIKYPPFNPGVWKISLTKMTAFSVEIPGTFESFCSRVNSFETALNWLDILSKI